MGFSVGTMVENGEKIPNPSTVDDVVDDPAIKDAVAFLVPAHSERTIRVKITAPASQIEKIDRLARAAGLTRSAFLVRSAIQSRPAKRRNTGAKKLLLNLRKTCKSPDPTVSSEYYSLLGPSELTFAPQPAARW
jgi:hypothetical protein